MNVLFLPLHVFVKGKLSRVCSGVLLAVALSSFGAISVGHAQPYDVFSRGESSTSLWWDDNASQRPWFYNSGNQTRPDLFSNLNRVIIGHNNNTTMTVNGTFFQIGSLTIQGGASSARTYNSSDGGGISFRQNSAGFTNQTTSAIQTFNVPIGIDATTVTFQSTSAALTAFTSSFFLNANTAAFSGTGNFELSGVVGNSGVAGQITKGGSGILTLSGSAENVYTGLTTVSGGTLRLDKSSGNAIIGNVTVSSGGTLLLARSNQVDSGTGDTVTLSGGTIQRASGVSETFGNLNVTSSSVINFGGTAQSNFLEFGSVTGGGSLIVASFLNGNQFKFAAADLVAGTAIANSFTYAGSDARSYSFSGSTFTITAIPEPSTYLAAAGLFALFLWPIRRRLLKDAKFLLGLCPTGRA